MCKYLLAGIILLLVIVGCAWVLSLCQIRAEADRRSDKLLKERRKS